LTALAAAADGWGRPIDDLRAAEAWFHRHDIRAAARSCRDVLRTLGAPIQYRRDGTDAVPPRLRAAGVTAREYEICLLVRDHLDNRTIGERLHISHRTVEKHVATLLAKLTVPNRRALIDRITEPSSMQPH
jgi:DNA-binding CsgD family transcriptional regulator